MEINSYMEKNKYQDADCLRPINLDCFTKIKKIGKGSFAKVYTIRENTTGKILAAKVLNQQLNEDLNISDVHREINIILKLTHPAVLKFYGYCLSDFKNKRKLVIITDFASNGTLKDLLAKERENGSNLILNATRKLIIIYGIANAMLYLHSHDIIHRDLKPENILLDEYLHPKIADFGLSKKMNKCAIDSVNDLKGTPIYMAPEIYRGHEYTKAVDVYAFALIVYEIMTNEQPFSDISFFTLVHNLNQGYRPPFKKKIPQSYQYLIENCWSEDPTKRFNFQQIFLLLRMDQGIITEDVQKQDYLDYIEYLSGGEISFERITKININENIDNLPRYINDLNCFQDKDNYRYIFPYKLFVNLNNDCKKLVEKEAENDSKISFLIGKCLIEGQEYFFRNVQLGIKHLKWSMKSGLKESAVYYCKMIIKGNLIPMNLDKARKILEKYLKHHEDIYLLLYAKIYMKEQKYKISKQCYEKLIQLGNSDAIYEYGKMIFKGKGFTVDQEKAIQYYKSASEKGCVKAIFKYGMLLKTSENEEIRNEGIKYIKIAADNGYTKAMYEYSLIIKDDQKDSEEYLKYLKSAANKGHTESMYEYGLILSTSKKNKYDINNCIRLLKNACDKGHIKAIGKYGQILVENDIVPYNYTDALKYIKIAKKENDERAMTIYGLMYQFGFGVPVNYKKAVKYYKKAVDKNDPYAMHLYAHTFYKGIGVEIDFEKAIKYYKLAIDNGYSASMSDYAIMLFNGHGVEANKEEAIKYIKMAIDNGETYAMYNYGYFLQNGIGMPVNKVEAAKYYKMASIKGLKIAMNAYAQMLMTGDGIPVDVKSAEELFIIAINRGNTLAMTNYANYLEKGIGVQKNLQKAAKYLKMAADQGDSVAMNNYSLMLLTYSEFHENISDAAKYCKMAIGKGVQSANLNYAHILENGIGVPIDKIEALKYYEISANNGYIQAMRRCGDMLIFDDDIPQNPTKATKYYKMAIEKNDTEAMIGYAIMLKNGVGVPVNINEAYKYLKMASDKGNQKAMNIYASELESEENFVEAIKYYKMAIDNGNTEAMCNYACMLLNGKGVDKNLEEAIKYCKMAADAGNAEGMYTIGYFLLNGIGMQENLKEAAKYFKCLLIKETNILCFIWLKF